MKLTLLITTALLIASCSKELEHKDTLAAHNTVERVREEWVKQTKPLEIRVIDRTKEELQAIDKIGVYVNNAETATEFSFDGESFKPATSIMVDTTVNVRVGYPFQANFRIGDTINISQTLGQYMYGNIASIKNLDDKIMVNIELKDITALLRIKLKSDNIEDFLNHILIENVKQTTDFKEYPNGIMRVSATTATANQYFDCPLNNGMAHDFFLLPVEESSEARFTIEINGKDYHMTTVIPPLRRGSITELHIELHKGKLTVGSSWVDTKYPFIDHKMVMPDSVRVGYFLQKNGSISTTFNHESIAMVIETNGKHGRAVALKDGTTAVKFGQKEFRTGKIFDTVDGSGKEGCFYSKKKADGETLIQFTPKVVYSNRSAFSQRHGAELSMKILDNCSEAQREAFEEVAGYGTAYIPSLYELASLAQEMMVYSDKMPKEFRLPIGYYMTSCESGPDTFYALDMNEFRISAYNSKTYPNTKLRLFYLF